MKIGLLVVFVVGLSVTCTTWANDLPSLGYSPGIPVKDLVAKGYRWVTVNGPYACVTEQDVRQITSDHTDLRELHMVENLQAYYLIPGTRRFLDENQSTATIGFRCAMARLGSPQGNGEQAGNFPPKKVPVYKRKKP